MSFSPSALLNEGRIDPSWLPVLEPVAADLRRIEAHLSGLIAEGETVLPARENIFRALQTPFEAVRVLILGQDPYPTPGHSIGLAFATERHVRPLPRSLNNIYRELRDDLGIEPPQHGDLRPWANQGVLLLNRALTVTAGSIGSHRVIGWEAVTGQIISQLARRDAPLVGVLWGREAQKSRTLLPGVPLIESAHPSPLSASRGFFGSRPFSRINGELISLGAKPIDWRIGA